MSPGLILNPFTAPCPSLSLTWMPAVQQPLNQSTQSPLHYLFIKYLLLTAGKMTLQNANLILSCLLPPCPHFSHSQGLPSGFRTQPCTLQAPRPPAASPCVLCPVSCSVLHTETPLSVPCSLLPGSICTRNSFCLGALACFPSHLR